jgi:flagellar basal-body rod protein FlgB
MKERKEKEGGSKILMNNGYISFIHGKLNLASFKRDAIANNIANFNTPGFKAKKVIDPNFENKWQESLKTGDLRHISNVSLNNEPQVIESESRTKPDGNNVDLNIEMMEMIQTQSQFSKSIKALNAEIMLQKIALGK